MITVTFINMDKLLGKLRRAPSELASEIGRTMGQSMLFAQREAQARTPVEFGILKSSIGGSGGYFINEGLKGEVGTNVDYAFWVEVRDNVIHKTGQAHFMEEGAKAAEPFIQKEFEDLAEKLAKFIVS